MVLSYHTAASAALTAARAVVLAGLGTYWVCFCVFLFSSSRLDWTSALAGWGLSLAAWGCISLVVLCTVIFADVRSGLDGAVGLACILPGCTVLVAGVPADWNLSWWLYVLSAGVGLALGGILLAVVTLKPRRQEGGIDAHPQV